MHVAIGGKIAERDLQPAVAITIRISRRAARAVQQHTDRVIVAKVGVEITVELPGYVQRDLNGPDLGDTGGNGFKVAHAGKIAVRYRLVEVGKRERLLLG